MKSKYDKNGAVRKMTAAVWLQHWLGNDQGLLDQLSRIVTEIDSDFLWERETYPFSDWGANDLLRYRRARVSGLLPCIDESWHAFLLARIEMPVDLPPLRKTLEELYLSEMEKKYGRVSV